MKCDCSYIGIPTVDYEKSAGSRQQHWKCPQCHRHRGDPGTSLRHDWMEPETPGGVFVCAQCGMTAPAADEDRTPCPGHGANWTLRVGHCLCGEWGPLPGPFPLTATCARCGAQFPAYPPPAPPKPPKRTHGQGGTDDASLDFLERLRVLLASTEPVTMQDLVDAAKPKGPPA